MKILQIKKNLFRYLSLFFKEEKKLRIDFFSVNNSFSTIIPGSNFMELNFKTKNAIFISIDELFFPVKKDDQLIKITYPIKPLDKKINVNVIGLNDKFVIHLHIFHSILDLPKDIDMSEQEHVKLKSINRYILNTNQDDLITAIKSKNILLNYE
jgi:hypothetical protein